MWDLCFCWDGMGLVRVEKAVDRALGNSTDNAVLSTGSVSRLGRGSGGSSFIGTRMKVHLETCKSLVAGGRNKRDFIQLRSFEYSVAPVTVSASIFRDLSIFQLVTVRDLQELGGNWKSLNVEDTIRRRQRLGKI